MNQSDSANEQHYEVNAAFYHLTLGPRLKYSSGFWPKANSTFEESEVAMLELYCQRAQLEDGMKASEPVGTGARVTRVSNEGLAVVLWNRHVRERTKRCHSK